ncbi:SigE family RNA polymerase sigma factor [Kineosporia sp. J2-2]|uniref:SigE family RNA polymerase sigma factor n=1 Tax=Kineosporia corallincola TaxID=2835133 RepID=A0ABS5TS85_9ACTN|nr:SigE family RNA polymerase sigma factor [Kineosporia corallincola]MBT0773648.1 SigE family RNA polymerase sigma factor [Kineosporia corallincola]
MASEEEGFQVFVQQHWRSLNRTAFLLTGDRGRAEDLVQSAFEKVHRRWHHVSQMDAPLEYVRRVMVTTAISWRRRRGSGEIPSLSVDVGLHDPYERIDQREQLIGALRQLPNKMRAALVLRYFEDLSEADVAAAMGCSVGTVKSHISRGLQRLREKIGDEPGRLSLPDDPALRRA